MTEAVLENEAEFNRFLSEVEGAAPGLSIEEVYDYFGYLAEDFTEEQNKSILRRIKMGQARAKKKAVDSLFSNMSYKGGDRACLEYLERFGSEWEKDNVGPGGITGFKVVLD